jgi:hypothetical protein
MLSYYIINNMADTYSPKGTQRGRDSGTRNEATIIAEARKLLKEAASSDFDVLSKLRGKFRDEDMVTAIFTEYKERLEKTIKRGHKFHTAINERYGSLSFPELLEKASKIKKKAGMSDSEFHVFLNIAMTGRDKHSQNMYNLPNTRMSRVLGYTPDGAQGKLKVSEKELGTLQEILKMYAQTKELHANVVVQSMAYQDCDPKALMGKYNPKFDNLYSYIHPVIASLFLPQIPIIDEHLLYANIGYIIKNRYEGLPLSTKPDYELYWNLITDPNDIVCDMESPIMDLKNRYILQIQLWQSVINLREGRYYRDDLSQFLTSINNCRLNMYDSPDLVYVKDEVAIFRQILSAFSLRPTIVSTIPLVYSYKMNPYVSTFPAVTQITSIPMINLRLPLNVQSFSSISLNLSEALEQTQWFLENKLIVPKRQSVLYSRDMIIFAVNRRYQAINITRMQTPFNFNTLPMTMSGFERINEHGVTVPHDIPIRDETYFLRSAILVERSPSAAKIITGCSALVRLRQNIAAGRSTDKWVTYDPLGAGNRSIGAEISELGPIRSVSATAPALVDGIEPVDTRLQSRGTIFIYAKDNGSTRKDIVLS